MNESQVKSNPASLAAAIAGMNQRATGAWDDPVAGSRAFRFGDLLRAVRRYPMAFASAGLMLSIVLAAVFAPLIAQHGPTEFVAVGPLQGPSAEAWLGTDQLSRDMLSRVLYGARTSLVIAGLATIFGVGTGTLLGLASGYFGGVVDLVVQRVLDVFDAFPALVLAILFVSLMGASSTNVTIAIAVVLIPGVNRVTRSVTLGIRSLDYIEAAQALGATHTRIMLRHIAPGLIVPVTILAAAVLGGSIIAEASLSFLGLGAPPPAPTLGQMLSNQVRAYFLTDPWLAIVPGVFLSTILLCTAMLGDSLRDVLDKRRRAS